MTSALTISRPPARRSGRIAAMAAALIIYMASAPASAIQVLDAVDHAELEAEVSATAVSRIAVAGDRIARVVRGPDGFQAEHDPASGDLYLRPVVRVDASAGPDTARPATEAEVRPAVLFIGTEKGFTYRLALAVADRGSAQILIRNAAAVSAVHDPASDADPRIGALAGLVRAVANREPLPGYVIEAGAETAGADFAVIEIWRGRRFTAEVLEAGANVPDAAALAASLGCGVAAVWLAASGTGVSNGRLAVIVRETRGDSR